MKKLLTYGFYVFITTILASSQVSADCIITGVNLASNDPLDMASGMGSACTGTITLTGTLNIDENYDISSLGGVLFIVDGGTLTWSANAEFNLSAASSLQVINGGVLSVIGGGSSNKELQFGGSTVSTANGAGPGGPYPSFAEVVAAGGIDMNGLPVVLTQFNLKNENNTVKILWQTATELNNDRFELQHSIDGKDFRTITTIQGAGFSTEILNYAFVHERPGQYNYYQLKQVDFDGKSAYSKVEFIYIENKAKKMKLFPTVVFNSVTILTPGFSNDMEVDIVDASGRTLKTICIDSPRTTLQVGALTAGTYWLRRVKPSGVEMHIFIKK